MRLSVVGLELDRRSVFGYRLLQLPLGMQDCSEAVVRSAKSRLS